MPNAEREAIPDLSVEWILRPLDRELPAHVRTVLEREIKTKLELRNAHEIARKEHIFSPAPGLRFYRIEIYAG